MATLISFVLVSAAGLLCIPVLTLFVEVVAALRTYQEKRVGAAVRKRVAVIVPAHNESSGLVPTIEDLRPQLGEKDRLIVVADNCSDDTGVVAARAGAEVIVRSDLQRVGKGYALGWGISHIRRGMHWAGGLAISAMIHPTSSFSSTLTAEFNPTQSMC
jgi:cellulose synthase/poly-beta-1,6-N-acetylglucosamine synthase-like glycosyltransferase